ncbi:mannosyltransferase [Cellulophaga baltica]|uniref:glycosyltransferase 87 family protein n=1 Tax=Cellulophaga TaxID=104264 RepID=UPI001C07D0F8|nr:MULTISPECIES: glycosyltransferase 87 family protein [Cellulophaga]MBU2995492.1 mannosyltransferase [Cellulophaga baltica]MDO6766886.1 mannosyltransferase [Cellulophaga sp. 1_MG-2023]
MYSYWKLHKLPILLVLFSSILYYTFAYHFERTEFIKLITLFFALLVFCFKLIQFEKWNLKFLLASGIIFRIIFICILPNFSQDFYRFIWDGELVSNLQNPYLQVPNELIKQPNLVIDNAQELLTGMGDLSPKFHSNYPPLNQIIFSIASVLGCKSILGSVIVMRIIIILADIGIVYFGQKLLKNLNLSPHLIFWYFLNPLIIVELTGNLHFEGVMLFFFAWSLYLLSKNKWQLAGIIYACAISIKLVPLLFLPLFFKYFSFKKSIQFYSIVGVTSILLLAPFYTSEFISNYSDTVGLWFSNFEFNASVYNIIKTISITYFDGKPWEIVKVYGKVTPLLTIGIVLLFTFLRKNEKLPVLITSMLWVLSIYYFISTTVHPWYVVFLVFLTVFTKYRFALIWSGVIILSYYAYANANYIEHLGILALEYILVIGYMVYELSIVRNKK